MQKSYDIVKEYARRLNEDDLRFLYSRFTQQLGGDRGEAVEKISQNPHMDRLFSSAGNCDELFDLLDLASEAVIREHSRRFGERTNAA